MLSVASIGKQTLFPLETRLLQERCPSAEGWIPPLGLDPAYLHIMIFSSHQMFDVVLPQSQCPAKSAILPHLVKAVRLLRERLAKNDAQLFFLYTTAAVVVNLAGLALLEGDSMTAQHHMRALHKIMGMQGGPSAFSKHENAKFLLETIR